MATSTLSEAASKTLLSGYGVPFAKEIVSVTAEDAVRAAQEIGYPVVVKLSGDGIAHKTERGLVKLNLKSDSDVASACSELIARTTAQDGVVSFLVAEMVKGDRELIIGVVTDPQFGPMV